MYHALRRSCPLGNVLSHKVWPFEEVMGHRDDLIMRSKVVSSGEEVLYQEARLELILGPEDPRGK